jgi:asparagine synthase (glutamine-hydrolysing)
MPVDPALPPLQRAQAADISGWLPNDLLLKLDRCLMAHGLEGRTPFLDREVAAFAFHLPDRLKVRGRYGKWILRKWLERHCPAADPWAKKKGFTVPVAAWIAPRAGDLARTVSKHEGLAQVCDMEAVRAVFTRRGRRRRTAGRCSSTPSGGTSTWAEWNAARRCRLC